MLNYILLYFFTFEIIVTDLYVYFKLIIFEACEQDFDVNYFRRIIKAYLRRLTDNNFF